MVRRKWLWFRRHFLIDFVPSVPIGLSVVLLPGCRPRHVAQIRARVLRFARFLRGFGLMARGFDRLARQYGHVLNQNVILYPTRAGTRQLPQPIARAPRPAGAIAGAGASEPGEIV